PELTEAKSELERFLYSRVYRHPQIVKVRNVAQAQLREAFDGFMEKPHLLPRHYQSRAEEIGLHRTVGDYLAGMTDRYFRQQHECLFSE
ncbi:MAG: dGTPase, partial [Pirellulaceae bacterium]